VLSKEKKPKSFYLKLFLFMISLLLFSIVIIFGFLSIIAFLSSGNVTSLIEAIFLFVIFLITMVGVKKLQPVWFEYQRMRGIKQKTRYEAIKDGLPDIGFWVLVFVFYWLFEYYFDTILFSSISAKLTKELLGNLITFDGILIGFFGIVFAQFLSAIHNKGNIIYKQMLQNHANPRKIHYLNRELNLLKKNRRVVIFSIFYAFGFLIISVLLSYGKITSLEQMEDILISTRDMFFWPLLTTIAAIIAIIMSVFQLDLLPSIEEPKKVLTDYQ